MKLRKYCLKFIDEVKSPVLKESTIERYRRCCIYVPDIKMERLTTGHIQTMVNDMLSFELSSSSIKQTMTIVRQALKQARHDGICRNDLNLSDVILPRHTQKKVFAYSRADQRKLIEACASTHYGNCFLALLYTGMRVGELIALEYDDINFDAGYIDVNKTDWRGRSTAPKTAESRRRVPIIKPMEDLLMGYVFGTVPLRREFFLDTRGERMDYHNMLHAFHAVCDRAGVPRAGLHALRHTFATNALAAGVNVKALSQWLGHCDVSVTLSIYTDVNEDQMKEAAELVSGFLQPRAARTGASLFP